MSIAFTVVDGTGWTSNPDLANFNTCRTAVLNDFSSWLSTSLTGTFTIDFNWTNIGVFPADSSSAISVSSTYSGLKTLLNGLATDAVKTSAYATLPGSDPSGGLSYVIRGAHNAVFHNQSYSGLGFPGGHDVIEINSTTYTYDTDPTGTTCASGKISLYSSLMHELTELFGRWSFLTNAEGVGALDLFSYSSAGTRSFTGAGTRYYSYDGGTNNYGTYATTGDFGDFSAVDCFGASAFGSGGANPLLFTQNDARLLAVFLPLSTTGFNLTGLGGSAPSCSVNPSISGTVKTGNTLTVSNGTWTGSPTFTYQWTKNGSNIGGATSSTYTPTNSDRDALFACIVTGTNGSGNASATAASVGPWLVNTLGSPFLR